MKRVFTLFVLCFAVIFGVNGQSKKIALIEHFTQASCPPCASINPQIRPIVTANEEKVAIIHHQVSWPGFDPMNEQNPGDVQNRVTYYGIRGVPGTVLNGQKYDSPLQAVTTANINTIHAQNSEFDLDLQVDPYQGFDGLNISLNIKANSNVSGNLRAHVVVVEDVIRFAAPPGTNGEREFHHVLKEALPTVAGTTLSSDWTSGMTEDLNFSYEFENFYDWKNAGVVAFVQDRNSKEVFQAVHWRAEFEPNQGDDVLVQAANASGRYGVDFVCGGSTSPIVTVMNGGTQPLSSFDVNYSVNGSATSTYTWTGSAIGSFETQEVTLPAINFQRKDIGELVVEVNQPNGNTDVAPSNGSTTSDFLTSPNGPTECEFRIRPLLRPSDVSFKITDSKGNVVLEDGPFSDRKIYTYDLNLEENECYSIEVINDYRSVNGNFQVYDKNDNRIVAGTMDGPGTFYADWGTYPAVSNKDLTEVKSWSVSPNPGLDHVILSAETSENLDVQIVVTDLLGKTHMAMDADWAAGLQRQHLDVAHLSSGVYLISIKSGNKLTTKKWIKE